MKWHVLGALASAFLLAGCASRMSADEYRAYLNDPSAPHVIVQVCLPGRTASFDELEVDVTGVPGDIDHASQQAYADLALKAESVKELPGAGATVRERRSLSGIGEERRDPLTLDATSSSCKWITMEWCRVPARAAFTWQAPPTLGEPVYEGSTNRRVGALLAVGVRTRDHTPAQRTATWFSAATRHSSWIFYSLAEARLCRARGHEPIGTTTVTQRQAAAYRSTRYAGCPAHTIRGAHLVRVQRSVLERTASAQAGHCTSRA